MTHPFHLVVFELRECIPEQLLDCAAVAFLTQSENRDSRNGPCVVPGIRDGVLHRADGNVLRRTEHASNDSGTDVERRIGYEERLDELAAILDAGFAGET